MLEFLKKKPIEEVLSFKGLDFEIFRKAYYSKISIRLFPNGLRRITTRKNVDQNEVESFLEQNWQWILAQDRYYENLRKSFPEKDFVDGEVFPVLGKTVPFYYNVAKSSFRYQISATAIHISFNDQIMSHKKATQRFYQDAGKLVLTERVEFLGDKMSLFPVKLSFRSQKTRWGSCSSNGHISLNWRLLGAPLEVLDYVVVHELAHLRYMDHSSVFWKLVEKYSPQYEKHKLWLRENQFAFDFLARKSELYT